MILRTELSLGFRNNRVTLPTKQIEQHLGKYDDLSQSTTPRFHFYARTELASPAQLTRKQMVCFFRNLRCSRQDSTAECKWNELSTVNQLEICWSWEETPPCFARVKKIAVLKSHQLHSLTVSLSPLRPIPSASHDTILALASPKSRIWLGTRQHICNNGQSVGIVSLSAIFEKRRLQGENALTCLLWSRHVRSTGALKTGWNWCLASVSTSLLHVSSPEENLRGVEC